MPGAITIDRWRAGLARHFGMRSGGIGQVLDDVMPVASLLNPDEAEYHRGRGELLFTGGAEAAASVGNFNVIWCGPATSGVMTAIESVVLSRATAGVVEVYVEAVQASGSLANYADIRSDPNLGNPLPSTRIGNGIQGVLSARRTLLRAFLAASTPLVVPLGIVLTSDIEGLKPRQMVCTTGAVNEALSAWFFGYERFLEPQER